MLEWVVRRATDCQQLDGVIVATSDVPENYFVGELTPLDVPVFRAQETAPLGCLAAACEEYPAESIVCIGATAPFVDPELIDRLVSAAGNSNDYDYLGYCSRDGKPAIHSPLGVSAEWIRSDALRSAVRRARSSTDREHPTRYLYSHPERYRIRLLPVPDEIDREDVRLSVDMEEDWENALAIFDALGPEEFDWQRIADLLDHQPALRKRMAALNRTCAKR